MGSLKFWKGALKRHLKRLKIYKKSILFETDSITNGIPDINRCDHNFQLVKLFIGQLVNRLAVLGILSYKVILSPWMGGCCRYIPSCSEYAMESFKTYPFFKALLLSLKRILKCRPYTPYAYDPLPQSILKKVFTNDTGS